MVSRKVHNLGRHCHRQIGRILPVGCQRLLSRRQRRGKRGEQEGVEIPVACYHARLHPTIAFETLGPINSKVVVFFNQLVGRLTACTGDMRETSFLFQRLSVTVQRFNAICFQDSFRLNLADFDS